MHRKTASYVVLFEVFRWLTHFGILQKDPTNISNISEIPTLLSWANPRNNCFYPRMREAETEAEWWIVHVGMRGGIVGYLFKHAEYSSRITLSCLIFYLAGGEWRRSSTCWLFSLKNAGNLQPFKLSTVRPQNAILTISSWGPSFGDGDLLICDQANTTKFSRTNLGVSYQPPPGYTPGSKAIKSLLAGSHYFFVNNYEVFCKE